MRSNNKSMLGESCERASYSELGGEQKVGTENKRSVQPRLDLLRPER